MQKTLTHIVLPMLMLGPGVAIAEPMFIGGDVTLEVDFERFANDDETESRLNVRGEVAVGFKNDVALIGVGIASEERDLSDNDDAAIDDDDLLLVGAYGPATVTYGNIMGAGSITGEDYFYFGDATSRDTGNLRLDYASPWGHFALSYETEDDYSENDPFEIGVATKLSGNFLRAAWENDSEDLHVITGRELGAWGYHAAVLWDFRDTDINSQIGGTALYSVNDQLMFAGNLAFDFDGDFHSLGGIMWFELTDDGSRSPTARIEVSHLNEDKFSKPHYNLEFGIHIPFGTALPAEYERMGNKEDVKGFGFFDN